METPPVATAAPSGFLPICLIYMDKYRDLKMGVGKYANRTDFAYDFPRFKVFCVPFPLGVEVTADTVIQHLEEAGNNAGILSLVRHWINDPRGDHIYAFMNLLHTRGSWHRVPVAK